VGTTKYDRFAETINCEKLRQSHAALLAAAKAALAVLNGNKSFRNTQEALRKAIKDAEEGL
jgi:hypothetical protein